MKAIVQDKYGSADVLELRDVEKQQPGDDELLIRVHAAGRCFHTSRTTVVVGLAPAVP